MRLGKKFFEQNTLKVARELLGKTLAREWHGKKLRGVICETEAYKGFNDKASHACLSGRQASRGITPRTALMFGEAGRAYVYMIYGTHHCLNIVTEKNGYPAAVLIRSIRLSDSRKEINGPGRVCKFFHIDKKLNGEDVIKSRKLWIEDAQSNLKITRFKNLKIFRPRRLPTEQAGISLGLTKFKSLKIKRAPRIGVDYAGEWKNKPWRFYVANI
ncbi:MAG: DNA-3-methyladenine glycosylase [Candidatus Niyogibacteria bacterium]|nr:DNA-3-methyladenine glycosylase [Candidatus Niyogibacteria bacterium]